MRSLKLPGAVTTDYDLGLKDFDGWHSTAGQELTLAASPPLFLASPGPLFVPVLPERRSPLRGIARSPAFSLSPLSRELADVLVWYPLIPRAHLAARLNVSESRLSQLIRS